MNNIALFLLLSFCYSNTLVVPTEYPNIISGINASSDGDTILVLNGTYSGEGNTNLEVFSMPDIVLKSESGPTNCVIDCNGNGRWMYLSGTNIEIIGFKIENGMAYDGGALLMWGAGNVQIDHCIFYYNTATFSGGAIGLSIVDPVIKNCTFYGNKSITNAGDITGDSIGSTPVFHNCILVGNIGHSEYTTFMYYSCLLDTTDNSTVLHQGSFLADPLMSDPENGDFTLQLESPCVNAGSPNYPSDPDGTRSDIGVYPCFLELSGDVNFDGELDVVDIVLIVDYILFDINTFNAQLWAMNTNGDTNIDVIDIVYLVEMVLN